MSSSSDEDYRRANRKVSKKTKIQKEPDFNNMILNGQTFTKNAFE